MGFAGPGSADQADVGGAGEELAAQELTDLPAQWGCVAVQVQRRQGLVARQLRILQQPRDAPIGAIVGFERDELGEIAHVAPAFGGGALGQLEVVLEERGSRSALSRSSSVSSAVIVAALMRTPPRRSCPAADHKRPDRVR